MSLVKGLLEIKKKKVKSKTKSSRSISVHTPPNKKQKKMARKQETQLIIQGSSSCNRALATS